MRKIKVTIPDLSGLIKALERNLISDIADELLTRQLKPSILDTDNPLLINECLEPHMREVFIIVYNDEGRYSYLSAIDPELAEIVEDKWNKLSELEKALLLLQYNHDERHPVEIAIKFIKRALENQDWEYYDE